MDKNNRHGLTPLIIAAETVGKVIFKGDDVVYESTAYPGATINDCITVVKRVSGLKFNIDFSAGYSPERINPGDKEYTVEKTNHTAFDIEMIQKNSKLIFDSRNRMKETAKNVYKL